jgi:hypothetical protein
MLFAHRKGSKAAEGDGGGDGDNDHHAEPQRCQQPTYSEYIRSVLNSLTRKTVRESTPRTRELMTRSVC